MYHTLYKEAVPRIHGDCHSKHTNISVKCMYKARRKKERREGECSADSHSSTLTVASTCMHNMHRKDTQ